MNVIKTPLRDLVVLEPHVFGDERGFFLESFNAAHLRAAIGIDAVFVQLNHSRSRAPVLRGLHYQIQQPQGKLVQVVTGAIFDVAVDLRRSSPGFGKWYGTQLDDGSHRQMWIPAGFAHGFLVLSERADVLYAVTDYYAPTYERSLLWSDPQIGIDWPLTAAPILSAKDAAGVPLAQAEVYR